MTWHSMASTLPPMIVYHINHSFPDRSKILEGSAAILDALVLFGGTPGRVITESICNILILSLSESHKALAKHSRWAELESSGAEETPLS